MVFEVLGDNLLSLIKAFRYRGVPLPAVRVLARQILVGLDYLHSRLRIIHTDLKPENVMLREVVRPKSSAAASVLPSGATAAAAVAKEEEEEEKEDGEEGEVEADSLSPPPPPPAPPAPLPPSSKQHPQGNDADNNQQPPLTKGQKKKLKKKAVKAAAEAAPPPPPPAPSSSSRPGTSSSQRGNRPRTPRVDPAELAQSLLRSEAKIVDFGNACWTHKQFTSDIQTRQYRSPEVREV